MNPTYGLPETAGVFTQFSWSDVDFFFWITDTIARPLQRRMGTTNPPGETQLRWLLDALTTSRATFKVAVGGGRFSSPYDRWEGYAHLLTNETGFLMNYDDER